MPIGGIKQNASIWLFKDVFSEKKRLDELLLTVWNTVNIP